MILVITILISLILSLIFSLRFKNSLILLLIVTIPFAIILEILITKDIASFYYRYYYHWLFFLPLLLVLPFGFIKKIKKTSKFTTIFFIIWITLLIFFPIRMVINNIKYLSTDSTWFDSFSREYALHQVNIYDYIDWQYPKTKGIIKWCENREEMTDLYALDPNLLIFDNEKSLHAFFVKCNYKKFNLEMNKTPQQLSKEIMNNYQGEYYLSLERCQSEKKNLYTEKASSLAWTVDQELICTSKQVIPYLYIFPRNR